MHILIIEDNPDLNANLIDDLGGRGHSVDVAYNGYAGLGFALEHTYDVIVLDLMLLGIDGLEVCARLRREGITTPVLMRTARDSLGVKLDGFASGADGYLIKPFALLELEARLRALSRRQRPESESGAHQLRVADQVLDIGTYRVTRGGQSVELPPIPLKLLELLMKRWRPNSKITRHAWRVIRNRCPRSPPRCAATCCHMAPQRTICRPYCVTSATAITPWRWTTPATVLR